MVATSVVKPSRTMNCAFLIVNEVVLAYHCKMELLNGLIPVAHLVNPEHLNQLVVMSHHPDFTVSSKSLFKCPEQELHEYHYNVLNVWWRKLDPSNPSSYFRQLTRHTETETSKERYGNAISNIVQSLKKVATYLAMECCVQDPRIREMLFKFASIYDALKKKKDRAFLIDTLFALYTFQFDDTLIKSSTTLTLLERETAPTRMCRTANNSIH